MADLSEIQSIKQAMAELSKRVAAVELTALLVEIPSTKIELRAGERYAGLILGEDGKPSHHLVLLPGEATEIAWEAAGVWAKDQDGELPTRREQSLLFANLKDEFESAYYWSGEQLAAYPTGAWTQGFSDGYQGVHTNSYEARARAVRRLPI